MYSTLNPIGQASSRLLFTYGKVAAAGGYRNYERDHLNALSGIFVPKSPIASGDGPTNRRRTACSTLGGPLVCARWK